MSISRAELQKIIIGLESTGMVVTHQGRKMLRSISRRRYNTLQSQPCQVFQSTNQPTNSIQACEEPVRRLCVWPGYLRAMESQSLHGTRPFSLAQSVPERCCGHVRLSQSLTYDESSVKLLQYVVFMFCLDIICI